jgi:hypothetical protein
MFYNLFITVQKNKNQYFRLKKFYRFTTNLIGVKIKQQNVQFNLGKDGNDKSWKSYFG